MTITNRNLQPGTLLKGRHKGDSYLATVIDADGPAVEITDTMHPKLDGQRFPSLSKAAMAITGNSVNGWRFWSVAAEPDAERLRSERMAEERREIAGDRWPGEAPEERAYYDARNAEELQAIDAYEDPVAAAGGRTVEELAEETRSRKAQRNRSKMIFKIGNQRSAPEGQVRWFCNGCMSGFTAPEGERPEACPQGHSDATADVDKAATPAS